ncbi:MAG: enoyl-CoA hydratase-related protein [Dehalococcoidia bacterium]|nr:enoyl-CoA hydratase-related protein [Dehalococcoidia bacterium]
MADLEYDPHPAEGYAVFTLNRPQRLNAIGGELMSEFLAALESFTNESKMRVGIVTGSGRAFSAGADMREGADRDASTATLRERLGRGEITQDDFNRESRQNGPGVRFDLFSGNKKPFIAAINGLAIGGGMHWAMDCDIRIASEEAYLGLYEPKRGITAGYGSQYLGRMVPFGEAMYILLTSDRLEVNEARRIGLVHEVLAPDALLPRAIEIARMIVEGAPMAIEATKAVAHFWMKNEAEALSAYSSPITSTVQASEDVVEGRRAFVEKRDPVWKGR